MNLNSNKLFKKFKHFQFDFQFLSLNINTIFTIILLF